MTFDEWWQTLTPAEHKTIGINNAKFVWQAAQREWVGLTDKEIEQGQKESWVTKQAWESAVWWAEAKLKEKNHG